MIAIITYIVIVLSAVVHEFFHGWVAYMLGDNTAKYAGRLTLNPIKHMDLMGTVVVPLLLLLSPAHIFIGWAKPVPYNPYNMRDKKFGSTKVALAGPLANLLIALIFGLALRFSYAHLSGFSYNLFVLITAVNLGLMIFNLIPVPPLDGSKLLMDLFPKAFLFLTQLSVFGIVIALFIGYTILPPLTTALFTLITGIRY